MPPVTAETTITFITVCKGRLAHLKQSLPAAAAQAPCVVVDDACPDGAAAWVGAKHPAVTVVPVDTGGSFSVAAGRNAGAAAAATDWLCFLDADVVPAAHFVEALTPLLRAGQYYRPWPVAEDSWGAVLCARSDFARVGGYDEAFEEWGGEDDDLYQRLQAAGVRPAQFPGHLLSAIAHDDVMRMQFHSVKDREISRRINFAYMGLKTDLRAIVGSEPALTLRRALFAEVRRVLSSSLRAGGEARISMTLPDGELLPGWTATRTLVYSFPPCALTPPAIGSGPRA
jgi:GT2 family glycosyltransferase